MVCGLLRVFDRRDKFRCTLHAGRDQGPFLLWCLQSPSRLPDSTSILLDLRPTIKAGAIDYGPSESILDRSIRTGFPTTALALTRSFLLRPRVLSELHPLVARDSARYSRAEYATMPKKRHKSDTSLY